MNPVKIASVIATFTAVLSLSAQAQVVASDNAGNYSSWGGPQNGSGTEASLGTGFGSWQFNNTDPNGGFAGQFPGSSGTSMDTSGKSFGFYANNGADAESQAVMPFSEGSLEAYQTFSVQMVNGNISDNGGQVGFDLQNSTGGNLFQFYFNGGASDYYINVNGTQISTGVGYSSSPLTMSFTQLAGDAWSFTVNSTTLSSTSTGDLLANNNIAQVDLFSLNGATPTDSFGNNGNLFFNNVQIVPEPATLALFGISGLGLLAFRRRK